MSRASSAEAVLVLEDGRTFHGEAYGAVGETFGERAPRGEGREALRQLPSAPRLGGGRLLW